VTRVVHVVVAGEVGGAERMLVDLASRGGDHGVGHAVALVTPNDALRDLLRGAGLRVHDRGPAREGPLPYLWRSLGPADVAWAAGVLRDERADVTHLHTFGSQVLGTRAARRAGARVVRTEHSTRVYDDPSCWPFSRWSLARANAMVAVSAHVRDVALRRAPWAAPRMRVVHNGVDVARWARSVEPRPDGPFTLVVVGRLDPRKGLDLAIAAVARIPEVRLEVVGVGAERAALEANVRARRLEERVHFHGQLADTRPLLARAHAALCSSRSEGLGIALLEAMATGLPVVGFRVGGVPEIVDDGVTGMLCRAGDISALEAVVRRAMADRAALGAMGETGATRVRARFSLEAMASGYAEVYASLAGSSSARTSSGAEDPPP
jgi:glycosyltransferase involved in cell wall biosynthesis